MKKAKRKKKGPKGPPKTRWELSAERENARRFKRAPLFVAAGIVPLATPEERRVYIEGIRTDGERRLDEQNEEARRRGEERRGQVRALVSAEKFAELEERCARWPSPDVFYGHVLDELAREAAPPPPPPVAPTQPCRPRAEQAPLFVEVVKADGREIVPAVEHGRGIAATTIADLHGGIVAGTRRDEPEAPPSPCTDCGWTATPDASRVLTMNIHPTGCVSLRAILLGLSERCVDCKARRRGPCEAHRARCLACSVEGCIPGPSPWSYVDAEVCTRCKIRIGASPYRPSVTIVSPPRVHGALSESVSSL